MTKSVLLTIFLLLPMPVAAEAQNAPDVVRLNDGGMVRGTIEVLQPTDHVQVRLSSGEVRRYSMTDVRYAGPWTQETGVVPSSAPAGGVSLRFESDDGQPLTLFRLTDVSSAVAYGPGGTAYGFGRQYERLCTAPCDIPLVAGAQSLAIANDSGMPVDVPNLVHLPNAGTLRGSYTSNAGIRTAGWIVMTASMIAGLVVMLAPAFDGQGVESSDDVGSDLLVPLLVGGGIMLGGGLIGLVMAMIGDSADVAVEAQ